MYKARIVVSLTMLIVLPQLVGSTDFWVAPRKGQDVKQQQKDEEKCNYLAKKQTNFDYKKENKSKDHVIHYAIIGAIVGTAIGANIGSANFAEEAAVGGAIIGGGLGGLKKRKQVKEEEVRQQKQKQKNPNYIKQRNRYSQAYISCLEAKGYRASEY